MRRIADRPNPGTMELSFKVLIVIFLLLLSLSLLLLKTPDVRPYLYYVLVAIAATVIFLEIVATRHDPRKPLVILPQIMVLSLSIIWGVTLKYYYYTGWTDVLGHAWFAENLVDTGHVSSVFGVYQAFPLWHILSASLYMISAMPVGMNEIMYLACGLVFFALPIAVYLISLRLAAGQKIALVSALILAVNSDVLIMGMYSIARSIASLFLVVLLLILLADRAANKKETPKMLALALFFTLVIIVFHTVSILFVLALLGTVYVLQKVLGRGTGTTIVSGKYLLISIGMTMAYWLIFAGNLVQQVLDDLLLASSDVAVPAAVNSPVTEIINYLQYVPYLLFVILGILIVLNSRYFSRELKLFSAAALLFIPLTFPGPLLMFTALIHNFNLTRFNEYAFIFLGITAAVGLVVLYRRDNKAIKAICIIVFALWILCSVSNDFVASDNPLAKRPSYTTYLTQGEITGINNLVGISSASSGLVLSDYVVGRYLEFSPYGLDNPHAPLTAQVYLPDNQYLKQSSNDIVLIREDELARRPLLLLALDSPDPAVFKPDISELQLTYIDKDNPACSGLDDMDQVYDSSSVRGFK